VAFNLSLCIAHLNPRVFRVLTLRLARSEESGRVPILPPIFYHTGMIHRPVAIKSAASSMDVKT